MQMRTKDQPIAARIARGVLAVALAFGAAAASAEGVYKHVDNAGQVSFTDRPEAPVSARELEAPPAKADSIRGRSPALLSRAKATDRKEAERRLAQAQRELRRGPDMQQGIPPSTERTPGDRRRARVATLQRTVDAAQARAREVNAIDYSASQAGRAGPVTLATSDSAHSQ
jgi:hypothetical protein